MPTPRPAAARPTCRGTARTAPACPVVGTALLMLLFLGPAGCAGDNHLASSRQPLDLATLDPGPALDRSLPATTPSAAAAWWQAWQDPQLDRLVELAIAQAPDLQQAQARLDQALATLEDSRADQRLQLEVQADASADRFPGHDTYPAPYAGHTGSSARLISGLRLHLDFWGKWRALGDAARWRLAAADHVRDDTALSLQAAVTATYLQWDANVRLLAVQGTRRDHLRRLLQLTGARQRSGLSSGIEVAGAHQALATLETRISQLQRADARNRHALAELAGQSPAFAETLRSPQLAHAAIPVLPGPLPAHLVGLRPDLAARRSALEAAARTVDAARASFYPDVDLGAFAGVRSLGLSHLLEADSGTAEIGPAFTLPIFDGGHLRSNLKARIADYEQAVAGYDATLLRALRQVADANEDLRHDRQRLLHAYSAHEQAERIASLQDLRARHGLADERERLDAGLRQLNDRIGVIEGERDLGLAQIALASALGGVWPFPPIH